MAYGQGMGGGPDSSGVEGLGADAFGDGNTEGGGRDANAGPETDQANAIEGMANALDNAANADPMGSGMEGWDGVNPTDDPSGLGYGSGLDGTAPAMMGEDPSGLGFGGYGSGLNNTSPSVSLDSLGATPSLGELSAAIGIDPSTLGSVNPSDDPSGLGYGSGLNPATVEQESPGQKTASFLDDFNQASWGAWADAKAYNALTEGAMGSGMEGWEGSATLNASPNVDSTGWDSMTDAQKERAMKALNFSPNYANIEAFNQYDVPAFNSKMNEFGLTETPAFDPSTSLETAQFDMDALEAHLQSTGQLDDEGWGATPETTPAPKYGPKKSEEMYPGHAKKAAMAGVASIKSMFDGTHQGWIDAINEDMEDRGIALSHTLDGKAPNGIPFGQEGTNLSGKHSAANWGEYDAMFSPNENGVPVDENGIAMPGTEKQAQAGLSGVLQGLWGGILSGLVGPSASSGVVDPTTNENIPANIQQDPTGPENAEGPEYILDIMRSIYPWAKSLPDSILFNAVRYPDYLRLLIEADASGKELPLVVPKWILDGESAPLTSTNTSTSTSTGTNWITNHPAMQIQKPPPGWGVRNW